MDYHKNVFQDHSLIVKDEKGNIISIFPANESNNFIFSHQGLTFGGFLIDRKMTTQKMLDLFNSVLDYYRNLGFEKLIYKSIPHIYTSIPSEEDR
ncbi:GNAT family N-acetyltransferase, partial [Vibrio lentus]